MTGSVLNMYVFIFAFAAAFLLAQKRPMLALGYAAAVDQWYRGYLGVATLIANFMFICFAAIDFHGWQKKRLEERG
jgi:hypothetical protein